MWNLEKWYGRSHRGSKSRDTDIENKHGHQRGKEKAMAATPELLPGKSQGQRAWRAAVHGVAESRTQLSDFTFTFHFHELEKEMATHSSVLAWRIPGMGEPGGLPSLGSCRVGRDCSDLAASAYLRLLIFLPAVLIPACASSSPLFLMMYSA